MENAHESEITAEIKEILNILQTEFDSKFQLFQEKIHSGEEVGFRYDAPLGFALSVSLGDMEYSSVSYGDESSRIIHNDRIPIIVTCLCISVDEGEYERIVLYASHEKYENDVLRIASICGVESAKRAVKQLSATIVVDLF